MKAKTILKKRNCHLALMHKAGTGTVICSFVFSFNSFTVSPIFINHVTYTCSLHMEWISFSFLKLHNGGSKTDKENVCVGPGYINHPQTHNSKIPINMYVSNQTHQIKSPGNCKSENVIYMPENLYIGISNSSRTSKKSIIKKNLPKIKNIHLSVWLAGVR